MPFKTHVLTLALAMIVFPLSAVAATPNPSPQPAMPHLLYRNGDARHAVFLDASVVIDQGGKLKRDAPLDRFAEKILRDVLAGPSINGCIAVGEFYFDYINLPRRFSLQSAVTAADFVVEGKVTNRAYGFVGGVPGQLLRVDTISALKGLETPLSQYYIFIPVADFTIAGVHFCKTDGRYPSPPQIGDRVFVFGQRDFASGGEYIDTLGAAGYVRVLSDGTLLLPKSLRIDDSRVFHESDVRALIPEALERRVSR
jgi:hypothetical protein